MGAAEEAIVLAFMSAWGDGSQAEPDVDTILSLFTDDAVWQLWVPGGPALHGRDEIKADIDRQLRFATHMRCGSMSMASNDRQVFTERLDRFVSTVSDRSSPCRRLRHCDRWANLRLAGVF